MIKKRVSEISLLPYHRSDSIYLLKKGCPVAEKTFFDCNVSRSINSYYKFIILDVHKELLEFLPVCTVKGIGYSEDGGQPCYSQVVLPRKSLETIRLRVEILEVHMVEAHNIGNDLSLSV